MVIEVCMHRVALLDGCQRWVRAAAAGLPQRRVNIF